MIVLIAAGIVVVMGLVVAAFLGRTGGMRVHPTSPTSTAGGHPLPPGPVTSDTVAGVRFDRTARGYRMDQVDAVLDRVYERLAELESEVGPTTTAVRGPWPEPGPGPARDV